MTVDWDEVMDKIKEKMTKKQRDLLMKALKDYGDPEDFIVDVVRKSVDPDLLTVSDIEMCMSKAMKVSAYVNAVSPQNNISSIVQDVVNEAYASDNANTNSNPMVQAFREMADAIRQQIQAEVMAKLRQSMMGIAGGLTVPQGDGTGGTQTPGAGTTPAVVQGRESRNGVNGSDIFTGDE